MSGIAGMCIMTQTAVSVPARPCAELQLVAGRLQTNGFACTAPGVHCKSGEPAVCELQQAAPAGYCRGLLHSNLLFSDLHEASCHGRVTD